MILLKLSNLIRAIFQLCPYRFLDLNHELLAIPLAISVPVIAGSIQLYLYLTHGTLCTKDPVIQLHYKLDINIDTSTVLFTKSRPDIILGLIMISVEVFLRIYGQYKRIKCCRSNRVAASNIEANEEDTPRDDNIHNVGPVPVTLTVALICFIILPEDFNPYYVIGSLFNDLLLLGLSFYWVTSSDQIKSYLKIKYNKLKVRLGFYDI